MKTTKFFVWMMMIVSSHFVFAQSKGEMPFTSSSVNANTLLRKAWVAFGDVKFEEGNEYVYQVLKEDSNCALANAFIFTENDEDIETNLRKAEGLRLSADEKMFIDGLRANRSGRPVAEYFDPLLKKYPTDYYLHLWIMYNNPDEKRVIEIGENIVKRSPKFAPAYNFLGYAYMNQKGMAKAEANFNKYVSLRPDLANVYDSKGDYMMRQNKFQEAIPLYEKAAAMGMKSSKNKAERAKARLKFAKTSEADINEIKNMIMTSFKGYESSNVTEIVKPYADQSIEIFDNQMANVGLPNINSRVNGMFKNGTFSKEKFAIEMADGIGAVAFVIGKTETVWKDNTSGEEPLEEGNAIFVLHKQSSNGWKVIADHFYDSDPAMGTLSKEDQEAIWSQIRKWNRMAKPGDAITEKHMDDLTALYSQQAIEIFPSQRSNIGIANLRMRWNQLVGTKLEFNSLGTLGVEGLGRRAVAWGIGIQNRIPKDSKDVVVSQFPWVMIFTKEKDDVWRILLIHWSRE